LFLENENVRKQWDSGSGEGGYICTNQGMIANIRILKAILDHLEQKCQINVRSRNSDKLVSDVREYLTPVIDYLGTASPVVIKQFRQQYAEAGVQASAFSLMEVIRKKYPDFEPQGLKEYISKTDTTNNASAWKCICDIETMIHKHVITQLKVKFGEGLQNWWHKGVKEKVRNDAMALSTKSGDYTGYEKYLHLIDLKEIIEDNWDIFSETYTINAKPTDSRAKRLNWYTELNNIRNKVDHPPRGGASDDELNFVMKINDELSKRLSAS
jgi:predicted nucleic acid-binding OB-fold protein